MNEVGFWEIIEQSKDALSDAERDGNFERQAEFIKGQLLKLPKDDVVGFAKIFHQFSQDLYTWDLWGAAYVMGGGCSDDSFSDFRSWIISLGRDAYELALTAPDELGPISQLPLSRTCSLRS